jgi:hypothetical protein
MYHDVVVFRVTRDFAFPYVIDNNDNGVSTKYYWAPGYGIIMKEDLKNNRNWELVNSYIVQ